MRCQARILDRLFTFSNTKITYHTTKECGEIAVHKYSVDDGDSEMSLCGSCFRRSKTKKDNDSSWLGFFDCSYPPEAKVKGSRWYFWTLANCPPSAESSVADEDELCEAMAECNLVGVVGDVAEGDGAEGDGAEGDVAEGDVADGDGAEGDGAEGDVADGDVAEGDVAEGDVAGTVSDVGAAAKSMEESSDDDEELVEATPSVTAAEKITAKIAELQALVKASRTMPVKEHAKILKEIINLRTELKKAK